VYTSSTLSLAALEYLLHIDPSTAPSDLVAIAIEIPDDAPVESLDRAGLPRGWEREIECPRCQAMGDAWVTSGRGLVLRVPAAPVPEEWNVLLNPRHELMAKVQVIAERPFSFDARLL
jgi:RES domain-containing protein